MGQMENGYHLFTPYIKPDSNERTKMYLDDKDNAKVKRGEPWDATVIDRKTGRGWHVRGASCGIPRCFCAAEVVEEVPVRRLKKIENLQIDTVESKDGVLTISFKDK